MRMRGGLALLAGLALAGSASIAQTPPPPAPAADTHSQHAPAAGTSSAATAAYRVAAAKMHKDMMITYSGNPDRDFVAGMIPHHQGAIDMARIEMTFGKDPELKKLAKEVIAAQEKEIAFMRAWLAKNPAP